MLSFYCTPRDPSSPSPPVKRTRGYPPPRATPTPSLFTRGEGHHTLVPRRRAHQRLDQGCHRWVREIAVQGPAIHPTEQLLAAFVEDKTVLD